MNFAGIFKKITLLCPESKSLSHCFTELFPIYQNKHWTIEWWDDRFVDPSSHRIILKIVGFKKYLCLAGIGLRPRKTQV